MNPALEAFFAIIGILLIVVVIGGMAHFFIWMKLNRKYNKGRTQERSGPVDLPKNKRLEEL